MELLLFIGAIWALLALFARWRNRNAGRTKPGTREPPRAADEKKYKKLNLKASELEGRREHVLSALREGKLNQRQITQVLEAASLYKFTSEEGAELRKALHLAPAPRASAGPRPCGVCGKPSIPGEDLCYSHQAK